MTNNTGNKGNTTSTKGTGGTIEVNINLNSMVGMYGNITSKESFYSSPEYFRAYHNYRKQKGGVMNWIDALTGNTAASEFDEVAAVFHGNVRRFIDKAIKSHAKENGGTFKE